MKSVLLGVWCALLGVWTLDAQEICKTPTDLDGQCIPIEDCKKLRLLIKESPEQREYLMQWHCGYNDQIPLVCCPNKRSRDKCFTFSGQPGTCKPLDSCPDLRKKLEKKPISAANLEYVQRSRCDRNRENYFCCEEADLRLTTEKSKSLFRDSKAERCGVSAVSGYKIIRGVETEIDAYPWMGIIEYTESGRPYIMCVGSLINDRYVLTAAHCLVTNNSITLGARSVRFGDYDVTNDGPDCVDVEGGGRDCTYGDLSIKIESIIVHPEYDNSKDLIKIHDIALIRLIEPAPYTDFIRPICLPKTDITTESSPNVILVRAGWGYKNETHYSDVKLDDSMEFADRETCIKKYSTGDKPALGASQICAGGGERDVCGGDSLGPFSYYRNTVMEIVESSCLTPSNTNGECISIRKCDSLLKLLLSPSRTAEDVAFIRKSQCGFADNNPLVCCPKAQSDACITPDGRQGNCIDLYSCPAITRLLTPPVPKDVFTFIQNSKCNGPSTYSVCCGPEVTISTDTTPINGARCQPSWSPPNPSTECCGLDSSKGNKIFGGTAAAIDQYPWLTIIEYRGKDDKIKLLCGGTLISGNYVLTAAHCVTGPVLGIGTPENVRVGDYDITSSGADCVPVEGGGEDCTEGEMVVPIEETIPHESYDPKSALRRHDIALIRLKNMVPYTDFIRPICLPSSDITLGSEMQTLYTAGWGAVNDFTSSSAIKLQVDLPLVTVPTCQPSYNTSNRRVPLWDGQLCAGGEKGKDSCKGDSGGPLMFDDGRLYGIVGVVSFGPTPCGIENVPGVYTKVFYYLPWIRSKIRP